MKRAALYVRVSTTEQAKEGYSIESQTEKLKNYCAALGWQIENVYTDAGFTGSNRDRPALKRMIKAVEKRIVNVVLVYKLDRLSRSQLDTLDLLENVFLSNGCDFVSISENFDTGSPFGRAMIGILAVFAQLEREQIRERMAAGREARAKNGLPTCAAVIPIGYEKENGLLVANDYEAMQIRMIYDSFLRGVPVKKITRDLNDAGYTHKYGKWNAKTVSGVLKSRLYAGKVQLAGKWYDGKHDPIVDIESCDAASRIFSERRKRCQNAGRSRAYLSGLLYCECGGKYHRSGGQKQKSGKRLYYYTCSDRRAGGKCKNKIYRADYLDNAIFDEIRKLATEPIEIEQAPDNIKEIEKEIKRTDAKIERLIELYSVGGINLDAVEKKIKAANEHRAAMETELKKASEKTNKKHVLENASGFSAVLDNGNFDDIRGLLESLIDKIVISRDAIRIFWDF